MFYYVLIMFYYGWTIEHDWFTPPSTRLDRTSGLGAGLNQNLVQLKTEVNQGIGSREPNSRFKPIFHSHMRSWAPPDRAKCVEPPFAIWTSWTNLNHAGPAIEPDLNQIWPRIEPYLNHNWAIFEPDLSRIWTSSEPELSQGLKNDRAKW